MKKTLSILLILCILGLAGCGKTEELPDTQPTSNGGSTQNVAFADTEWAVYDGYGVTMEYPSTWTLYCYAESASAANYSVLMVSTAGYLPSLLCNRKRPSSGHHPLAFRQRGGKAFL